MVSDCACYHEMLLIVCLSKGLIWALNDIGSPALPVDSSVHTGAKKF